LIDTDEILSQLEVFNEAETGDLQIDVSWRVCGLLI
jgi:hypothetical protein